ncbi:PREDICTED: dr1-associated corepressor [Poecilia mexicana]|uniref:Dr1-associated corepressor n=2 Tax=Poecilia TaxID=8080 RepID=A0A087XVL9_POEFO|nr:PREDICTED: dr1-associated corepressor [Poecilia formosa]XP_014828646.1 PREDICTED: dr1-associated corepressor [Poecilia mexicana]
MPSKKKKYNARFPPARIKKIMQTDEEIGKVAAAVPVIISRALELFLESLLTKACQVTQSRNAKTMTTSHLKQCIELEQQFDFLKDLVATVPDMQGEGEENHTEAGGEKVPRRGRKPGSGRKNGGAGSKGKDKKLSGTESEQEEDSEDSETYGDEDDGSQSSTNQQAASMFHSSNPPSQFGNTGNMVTAANPAPAQGTMAFAPHPSMVSVALPPPAPAPHKNEEDDDEDYDS